MNPRFRMVSLSRYFNSPARLPGRAKRAPSWHEAIKQLCRHMPRGRRTFWGIPFALGPKDLAKRGLIALDEHCPEVEVRLRGTATHVCLLHFSDIPQNAEQNSAGGELLAEYVLRYADREEHGQPIRQRFEVNSFQRGWGASAFAAAEAHMPTVPPDDPTRLGWGQLQTGVMWTGTPLNTWIYALPNPRPEEPLRAVLLRGCSTRPVAVLGITLYDGPGHPLRHVPRKVYKLVLPAAEKATASAVQAELDMGVVTRLYAAPAEIDDRWLKATDAGLGTPPAADEPTRQFLLEATGSEGATLTVKAGKGPERELDFGRAFSEGKARSQDRKARIQLLHPRTTWLYVTVKDGTTGKPTPTRAHFRGPKGDYIPPYGHHAVVNDKWFEDYGGDLQLGGMSYAYVPGRFQIELPVGEVYVELSKGFEYQPLRKKLKVRPGQRELELTIRRRTDWRKDGWVTADTHVHFISPQTAWLEGQGEGLNLINLLASQWGRLFTNVADITGELAGCSGDDTLVWVGTENRHHLLGHMSMLGTHGDPVFPMCTGGPGEAYLGDPDVTLLTEWAEKCRQREGVAIRPHFPAPICEEPAYFVLGKLDGAELRRFADPEAGSLDEFCFQEWYRYLNCGYRVAAVGGTDKMSAGMPVGGARTYAQLDPNEAFTFENWGRAVRAGRTFTTSGPIITLTVDGRGLGEEIQMPAGGGTMEVHAAAECIWPLHALEVVVNGKVVASSSSKRGARRLSLRRQVKVKGSSWVAARCGSTLTVQHCWPIHLGAHTSPVYVICGGEDLFNPSDASYMLTLIDGGMTYLDTLSVRYEEKRHREMKAIFEKARRELRARLATSG